MLLIKINLLGKIIMILKGLGEAGEDSSKLPK
jgi:hypothetical protein